MSRSLPDGELVRMAMALREHLTADQYTQVGLAITRDNERFADLMNERAGEAMEPAAFAAFVYSAARRVLSGVAS